MGVLVLIDLVKHCANPPHKQSPVREWCSGLTELWCLWLVPALVDSLILSTEFTFLFGASVLRVSCSIWAERLSAYCNIIRYPVSDFAIFYLYRRLPMSCGVPLLALWSF